jgi:hypothetical protein
VLLDLWSGGQHCCHVTLLLRWDGGRYVRTVRNWADPGYRPRQLDRDPEVELVSADARFGHRFSPFAFSRMPVQILALRSGRLVDVTREHPDELRRDRRRALQEWRTARTRRYGSVAHRGLAAAWAADSDRLDGRAATLRQLRRHARRGEFGSRRAGLRYVAELDRFLVRLGHHRR